MTRALMNDEGKLRTLRRRLAPGRCRPVWSLLHRSGLAAAIARRYAGIGAIFMFHHVVPEVSAHLDGELYISGGFLDRWLASLRRAGVPVLGIDAAAARIGDPGRNPSRNRFVVITFDDGYADNLTCALPILEKYAAPFTLYVTTDLVEGGGFLWWLGLEQLFRENDAVEVAPMARRFATVSRRAKAGALAAVSAWVGADTGRRAPLLRDVFRRYGVSVDAATRQAGLSPEQLRRLAGHPLATIGGHTVSHPDLTTLSEGEAYREMSDNKAFLENLCQRPVSHFAYPHGAGGEREAGLARQAGFRTALTTRQGCLFPEHRERLRLLPRCAARGSRMWLSYMHAQRQGAARFIASRGGPPVVAL